MTARSSCGKLSSTNCALGVWSQIHDTQIICYYKIWNDMRAQQCSFTKTKGSPPNLEQPEVQILKP